MTDRAGTHGHENQGNDIGFEREDLGVRPVFGFLISLAILGILIYYVIWGIFYFLDSFNRRTEQVRTPLVQVESNTREVRTEHIQRFPEPRLEENERGELDGFRYGEEEKLNSYGWVDEKTGIAHIPITQAIDLVAQRGLPTSPKTGTMPLAPVNLARSAAEAADTSNLPKSEQKGKKP
jgi:type II secretory pathway pseudopilin PulG